VYYQHQDDDDDDDDDDDNNNNNNNNNTNNNNFSDYLLPYNVATNCILTAPLCHVDIVRLLCSELSLNTQFIVIVCVFSIFQ